MDPTSTFFGVSIASGINHPWEMGMMFPWEMTVPEARIPEGLVEQAAAALVHDHAAHRNMQADGARQPQPEEPTTDVGAVASSIGGVRKKRGRRPA